jgi:superfamily II DNA/RNA helicase
MNFNQLFTSESLIEALRTMGIITPTDIQEKAIQPIMENKDVIAEAVTGSGKTLAYLLPAFLRIDTDSKDVHTLVLAPSHELALQINEVAKQLEAKSNEGIRSIAIIGNVNIKRQLEALKTKPHVIIGTPGRILELIKMKKLKAHTVKTIVIDEADKLLSKDNSRVVNDIIKTTLRDCQLVAVSASLKPASLNLAQKIMKDPVIFSLTELKSNTDIEHFIIESTQRDKIKFLRKLIAAENPKKAIVFLNRNEHIQEINDRLNYHSIPSTCIFGSAKKSERKKALDTFRSGKSRVLIASDLMARGLDFEGVSHIIHLDLPDNTDEYIHRSGRTGRAGQSGTSIAIVTPSELKHLSAIQRKNNFTYQTYRFK